MQKIRLGTNEDGSPQYLYQFEDGEHAVFTGPYITGDVTLPDGKTVDVTDLFIVAESPAEALAISDAIGARFEVEGHPEHEPTIPFIATPSDLTHDAEGQPLESFAELIEKHPTYDTQQVIDAASKGR